MAEAAVADQPAVEAVPSDPATGAVTAPAWRGLLVRTFWLWPALLTLALGTYHSSRPELWRDEFASWSAASRSTGQLLDLLQHVDAVSGAYYLFLHYWIALFGDSPAILRLPSALAMSGAAAIVALTGRKLFDTRSGLLAGLLFAVVPSVSLYSQQTRAYAFVVLFVSAATWLLLRAMERPGVLRWAGYSLCLALAGLFHMISVVFLLPHGLVVLLRWWRSRDHRLLWGFPAAVLAGALPLIPLVILGQKQVGRQIFWIPKPNLASFPPFWDGLFGAPLVGSIFLAMAVLPLAWSVSRRRALEIGLTAALPILAVWVISHGSTSYFLDRYLLFTVPAWAVLAGAAVTALRPRVLAVGFLIGTALLGINEQKGLRTATSHEHSDAKGAADVIAKGYRPGDAIVPVRGNAAWMMIDTATRYYLPRGIKPVDIFAATSAVDNQDLYAIECEHPGACLGKVQRIWVVTFTNPDPDPLAGLPKEEADALRSASFKPAEVDQLRALTVTLLERPASS